MEFDRPFDEELGAALGGVDDNNSVRDDGVPELHPEQQIREEEEMQTPPRRQPRGVGSQQPKGPRVEGTGDESTSGPGYMAVPPVKTMGRNRLYGEWSPVETLEGTVSRMQRDLDNLQTENRFLRTQRATGPVPLVRCNCVVEWMGRCDRGVTVVVTPTGRCPKCGIVDSDAPPGFQERTDGRIIGSLWITGSVGKLSSTVSQDGT